MSMASWASSPAARRVMQGNRKRDTRPELALRRALHRRGMRYRVAARPFPAGPVADVLFTRARVAVFVDGCFWHACSEHFTMPRTNLAYWRPKIERNVARDASWEVMLPLAGWVPHHVWEHEDPETAAEGLVQLVARRRSEVVGASG